jgi:hypothetical protein
MNDERLTNQKREIIMSSQEMSAEVTNPLAMFGLTQAEVPEFARADSGAGDENVGSEDQSTVTLALMQPLSAGVATSGGKIQPGQWRNSLSKEVYNELYISNIFFQKQFSMFYKRSAAKEGLVGVHDTLEQAIAALEGHPDKSQIEMIENGVHYVVAYDADGISFPAKIYMSKSAATASRDWNTQLANVNNGGARFLSVWKLSNEPRSNTKGSWWVPKVEFVGLHDDKVRYEATKAVYQALSESLNPASKPAIANASEG